jgi:hypothetical protein
MLSHQFHSHGRVIVQLNRLEANRLRFFRALPWQAAIEVCRTLVPAFVLGIATMGRDESKIETMAIE